VFVSFCSWNKTVCFIPSECFKATTSGFSHQQLVSEPRSSENRSVLGDIRIFKVVKNKFWSFHRVALIHTNSLAQKSTLSETEVAHTRHLKILHCLTTRRRRAQRLKTSSVHARHIEPLSRAEPSLKPSLQPRRRIFPRIFPFQAEPLVSRSRADRIFRRIFRVQPSELPDA